MIRQRYSMDDLLLSMRQKSLHDIKEIEYAFLEPNGKLSVFPYRPFRIRSSYPMPLILDGMLQKSSLKHIKKSEEWLIDALCEKNLTIKDVFYAFYKQNKIYIIKKTDVK